MGKPAVIVAVVCAALIALASVFAVTRTARKSPARALVQSVAGLHVSGANIVEANGNRFVMRGVSYPYAWHKDQHQFADIKRLGANSVRVVLDGSIGANEVSDIISTCRQNRLIAVLEDHDTTGYGDNSRYGGSGAITLDRAANYWIGLKRVLAGQEKYVVINVGNEPYGNNNTSGWADATSGAIKKLRAAGLRQLIMVDGPNWGQDWSGIMSSSASSVFASDPQRNTVFSVHMYGVYGSATKITDYYNAFQRAGVPLVVGEFGWKHFDGDVDEDAIINAAQSRGIGYLAWSWSGNSGGVEYLDLVSNFNPGKLTPWGERIFNGANGIRSTSKEATVYADRG